MPKPAESAESAPELIVIRHAESEWNEDGRWQGHSAPPLTALGSEQARQLARDLRGTVPDRVEVSDLLRARQTAAALLEDWDVPVRSDALYRELDLGEWSGLTREQIRARDPETLKRFDARDASIRPPGGECRDELWARVERALVEISERCVGEVVALVTHGGFVYALFPDADVKNATVHRGRADELLAALLERRALAQTGGDDSQAF